MKGFSEKYNQKSNQKKEKLDNYPTFLAMVPKAGLEPARVLPLRILSPARLPVPPLRLGTILDYHKWIKLTREFFQKKYL